MSKILFKFSKIVIDKSILIIYVIYLILYFMLKTIVIGRCA